MRLKEIAYRINAKLHLEAGARDPDMLGVYAANTMSELIEHASAETLLVTSLQNNQLIRVAELMDVPGICLVSGRQPDPELLARSRAAGAAILVSPYSFDETRDRIKACLSGSEGAPA
jgi:hypothetical protein